jgi:hypothetical protein
MTSERPRSSASRGAQHRHQQPKADATLSPALVARWDVLRGPAIFLKVPRTILILESTGALWAVILALATIISAFTEPGCKAPANDPHASLGDKYQSELAGWCRTKRAGSIFFWLAFGEGRRRLPVVCRASRS